jgi:hypothetical protein
VDHGKHGKHGNLLFEEETFRVRTAVFEVSRQLGTGFLEAVYQEALAIGARAGARAPSADVELFEGDGSARRPAGQLRMRAEGASRKASPVTAADISVFSVFSVAKSFGRSGSY